MSVKKIALLGAFLVLVIALRAPSETTAATSSSGLSFGDVGETEEQLGELSALISSQPPEIQEVILSAIAYGIAVGRIYGMTDTLGTLDPYLNFFSDPTIAEYRYNANRIFRTHNQKIARLANNPDTRAALILNEI